MGDLDTTPPSSTGGNRGPRLGRRETARAVQITVAATRRLAPRAVRRRSRSAEALAPAIHDLVVDLGPPFVKLSQIVASSPGLFPTAISDGLRDLLDGAPPVPWPALRTVIESELGRPVEDAFASIEPEPLAAASVAQVHGATLVDGRRVVVKVRRPGVGDQFDRDLRLVHALARLAQRFWPAARVFNPVGVIDDTIQAIARELDFRIEAASMARFAANLRAFGQNDRIRVPEVVPDLCTAGVLTMERVDGIKVDDLLRLNQTGLELPALLRSGVRAWVESAAEHGFFHGDVHAGNLLLDTEGRVVFLDFGIMGELDDRTRELVRRGVVALLHHRDFDEVTRCLLALGAHISGRPLDEQRAAAAIRRLVEPLLSMPLADLDYQEVIVSAVRMASPHGVQLPRALVLLVKQVIYFERYAKLVAPGYDILADVSLIDFIIEEQEGRARNRVDRGGSAGEDGPMTTVADIQISEYPLRDAPDDVMLALHELEAAFDTESRPDEPPTPYEARVARWRSSPSYRDERVWLATVDGAPVGSALLEIDRKGDNPHIAEAFVIVSVPHRRHGVARTLLRRAVEAAEAEGRTLLFCYTISSIPAGAVFAERLGADPGLVERESELAFSSLDRALLAKWIEEGPQRAPDHELLFVEGALPDELLEPFTKLHDVTNTAPRDALEMEDEHVTPDQVRDRERSYAASGGERVLCIARDRTTGELAGFTELGWHPGEPWKIHQFWTAVHPDHRGRALGKWLKAANLERAMERWPAAEKVGTGNAYSNDAMIGINDELGFRETLAWTVWQVPVERVRSYLDAGGA